VRGPRGRKLLGIALVGALGLVVAVGVQLEKERVRATQPFATLEPGGLSAVRFADDETLAAIVYTEDVVTRLRGWTVDSMGHPTARYDVAIVASADAIFHERAVLVVGSRKESGPLRSWSLVTGAVLPSVPLEAGRLPRGVALSPSGALLAVATAGSGRSPLAIELHDTRNGALSGRIDVGLAGTRHNVVGIAFDPDERSLEIVADGAWSQVTLEGKTVFSRAIPEAHQVFLPCGRTGELLLVTRSVGEPGLAGVARDASAAPRSIRKGLFSAPAWGSSETGERLVGLEPHAVTVIEPATGREVWRFQGKSDERLHAEVALSPSGRRLAIARYVPELRDYGVELWELPP
jgi:hypothetical protein